MPTEQQQIHPPDVQPPLAPVNRKRFIKWVIAAVLGLLLVAVFVPIHGAYWIGAKRRTLAFSVLNSQSNAPVASAAIVVFEGPSETGVGMPPPAPNESDPSTQRLSTNDNGKAEILYRFVAYGYTSSFTDRGRVRFGDRHVRVTATGYEPTQFRLGERIGEQGDIHDKSPIDLEVKLKPKVELP